MPAEAIFAALAFVGLFVAWVIVPSRLHKRHTSVTEEETDR